MKHLKDHGREVVAVYEDPQAAKPSYMMWLEWRDGQIGFIRDLERTIIEALGAQRAVLLAIALAR